MNYARIYDQIIERARVRILEGYSERHHIIPRSEGGTDDPTNLVSLTAREHFVCHWLLYRMRPDIGSRAMAFWTMACQMGLGRDGHYTVSSRIYEEARIAAALSRSKAYKGQTAWNKGIPQTEETKRKMSEAKKGKPGRIPSEEERRRLSEVHKGQVVSPETRKKLSEVLKKIYEDPAVRQKLSEAAKRRPPVTEEAKRRMSELQKRRPPVTEETKRRISEKAKEREARKKVNGITITEETRRRHSELTQKRFADPAERKRHGDIMRKAWMKRKRGNAPNNEGMLD